MRYNLDGKVFRSVSNTSNGEVGAETRFRYRQTGDFNEIYRTYFTKGLPARAFVGSGPLLFGMRFEMLGVAVKR